MMANVNSIQIAGGTMPTPPRTSLEEIVAAGQHIVDADGLDRLTMDGVAAAVGVRAPSLYKRVRNRAELIHLVANAAAIELAERIEHAATTGDPHRDLRAIVDAIRSFAHARPASYGLLLDRLPDAWRPDRELIERALEPLFRTVAALAGPEHELEAARTVVAWTRGFIEMELLGAFKLGGNVDDAYRFGVERLIAAIELRSA
jgi:AcrR family transcriptional regulator